MLNHKHFSAVLACLVAFSCASFAQSVPDADKIIGTEKTLDFTLYKFEIITLRDKASEPSYKQFRVSMKASDNLPEKNLWMLNATQANELLAYLKKFDDLRATETSKTGATITTRIGRIENTDLFFQLYPTTAAYLKIVDRAAPEIGIRVSYNDLQAMRRLLMEFLGTNQ